MIRMLGIIGLRPLSETEELTDKQKQLDVDKDGEIEGSDLEKLRVKKEDFNTSDMPAGTSWKTKGSGWAAKSRSGKTNYWYGQDSERNKQNADKWKMTEADHEVSMAASQLDDIIKNATELKAKLGAGEKDIPAWIQDHISQAQNFINQAATNFHKQESPEAKVNELSPKTMQSYKTKADNDLDWHLDVRDGEGNTSRGQKARRKIKTRLKGIDNAKAKLHKPGDTWTTSSGKKATKNSDGTITYSDN